MAYKIGTRVKKVSGARNVGRTGMVVNGPNAMGTMPEYPCDMCVRHDADWVDDTGVKFFAGEISSTASKNWTPIIPDGHRAGVKGECSLLDELLSREVKNETV